MNIRKATLTDANAIAEVHVDGWKTTYKGIVPTPFLEEMKPINKVPQWKDIIQHHNVYVAETDDGEIAGFLSGGAEKTGKYPNYDGEIYAIYISQAYQRNGLGRLLLRPMIEAFMKSGIFSMTVVVLEENPSRKFYESLGAKKLDCVEVTISGKRLKELVYGWDDISGLI